MAGACIAGGFGWTGKDWGGVVNMRILDFEFAPQFAAVGDSQTRNARAQPTCTLIRKRKSERTRNRV